MVWYKMRKDKLVSDDNIYYTGYGVDAYLWFIKVKTIKDISLDKNKLARQIKGWNHCRIKLAHLQQVAEDFVEKEAISTCNFKKNRI